MGHVTETAPWNRPSAAELELQQALAVVFRLDRNSLRRLHALVADELGELAPTDERIDGPEQVALAMMRLAADHLGLGPGDRLTVAKYRRVQSELGLIDSNRVISAFGSWTRAQHTLGRSAGWAIRARALKGSGRGHPHRRIDPLEALRVWLAQEEHPTRARYDRFRRERNTTIALGDQLLPSSQSVTQVLDCTFAEAIAVARGGELPPASSADDSCPPDPRELVGIKGVGHLARANGFDRSIVESDGFPKPAKLLDNRRVWLKRDVVDFFECGVAPERQPFWLEREILDANELAAAVELDRSSMGGCQAPPPYGTVGRYRYWWRTDVDRWLAQHERLIARRRRRAAGGAARREARLPTNLELGLVCESELERLAVRYGLTETESRPTRVLHINQGRRAHAFYWRDDIELWLRGERPPARERDELNAQVQTCVEIRKMLGLAVNDLIKTRRRRIGFPEPAGELGSYALWWRAEVAAWAERRASEREAISDES